MQEIVFNGKAAVPLSAVTGHFQKAFFLHTKTYELYGRVRLQPGVLGDQLYPLYFKCAPQSTVIPGERPCKQGKSFLVAFPSVSVTRYLEN